MAWAEVDFCVHGNGALVAERFVAGFCPGHFGFNEGIVCIVSPSTGRMSNAPASSNWKIANLCCRTFVAGRAENGFLCFGRKVEGHILPPCFVVMGAVLLFRCLERPIQRLSAVLAIVGAVRLPDDSLVTGRADKRKVIVGLPFLLVNFLGLLGGLFFEGGDSRLEGFIEATPGGVGVGLEVLDGFFWFHFVSFSSAREQSVLRLVFAC